MLSAVLETQEAQLTRRSRIETELDILKAIRDGAEKPTHIMYRANLSWASLKLYLSSMETLKLIAGRDKEGRKRYAMTDKGFRILEHYARFVERMNHIGEPFAQVSKTADGPLNGNRENPYNR